MIRTKWWWATSATTQC